MYAITFDLLTEDLVKYYPKSRTCAYYENVRAYRVEEWSDFTDRVKGAKRLPRNKRSLIEK